MYVSNSVAKEVSGSGSVSVEYRGNRALTLQRVRRGCETFSGTFDRYANSISSGAVKLLSCLAGPNRDHHGN